MNVNWAILSFVVIVLSGLEDSEAGRIKPRKKATGTSRTKTSLRQRYSYFRALNLIFDIDGTLMFGFDGDILSEETVKDYAFTFTELFKVIHVRLRPGAEEFLKEVCKVFACYLWTAKSQAYADGFRKGMEAKLSEAGAEGKKTFKFKGCFSLDHTVDVTFPNYVLYEHVKTVTSKWTPDKNLDPQTTIIIEDSPQNLLLDQRNGVIVPTFQPKAKEVSTDTILMNDLKPYLMEIYRKVTRADTLNYRKMRSRNVEKRDVLRFLNRKKPEILQNHFEYPPLDGIVSVSRSAAGYGQVLPATEVPSNKYEVQGHSSALPGRSSIGGLTLNVPLQLLIPRRA